MLDLPIDRALPEILEALRATRRLVLVAPPGSGKTTRVPPAILRAGLLGREAPALVVLQPRRVAARAVAARIADENRWTLGEEVGYHVRFERKLGPRTNLRVLTEGLLNRQMVADPFLPGVGGVILDEFHERNLHTDLALGLLSEIRNTVRDDLLLIVMSATLDAEPIARFLDDAPIVRVEGRAHTVSIQYRGSDSSPLPDRMTQAIRELRDESAGSGHVLGFLPGAEEIRRTLNLLHGYCQERGLDLLPLHGQLGSDEQDRAIRPSARPKVVLSTNIAETSITIEGITGVVDSGLARYPMFDASRGLDRLELGRISQASATQRAGRAGRTGPGVCVRLWSEREQRGMPEHDTAEIHRVDLASTVLDLHAWGTRDPRQFAWFERPPEESLLAAELLLTRLGAIDDSGSITDLGRALSMVPAHPRIGRMLVEAARIGLVGEGATLAALLSERDPLIRKPGDFRSRKPALHGASDLLERLDLVHDIERRRFPASERDRGVDVNIIRQVCKVRDDLERTARRLDGSGHPPEDTDGALLRIALLGYPDRVCRRRDADPAAGTMVGGKGVRLEPESVVRDGELFLALDPRESPNPREPDSRVRIASAIEPEWLDDCFPGSVRKQKTVRFDPERRRVEGVVSWTYLDLTLREERHAAVEPEEAGRVLAEALAPRARELFEADERVAGYLARLDLLRRAMPEADLPALDSDDDWRSLLEPACEGKRSEDELLRSSLLNILKDRLTYAQSRFVEEHAPESLAVPSGSKIRLVYEKDRPPILAARLQELFGWLETPRIAGGRVPVVLHLLGPNYRPVQVTENLRSFWTGTYFQVRKDLRARYPRHSWPEDPLTARPEAKGGRKS